MMQYLFVIVQINTQMKLSAQIHIIHQYYVQRLIVAAEIVRDRVWVSGASDGMNRYPTYESLAIP